jgi:methionyl-tRNA synthetase
LTGKFFVTTPIYYVNDIPHIGHAYTTAAADILARWNRLRGRRVFFLTGTDEHGQKVEEAATSKGRTPKEHADLMVENFRALWKKLNISNDAFIRTTDEEHKSVVQELLRRLMEKGEIEKRKYSGWYCTPDERFWMEKDVVEGKCPECGRPVEQIEEENYFFLMSKYKDSLIKHIEANPGYIMPETRKNEVLGFLKSQPLGDLCISRPKKRLSWGIHLPFDGEFVTYVWFDALVNYYSATRYLAPLEGENTPPVPPLSKGGIEGGWWPAEHHVIGKDILTTHAVYWSTMLMALDMPLPSNIFAHGWWTVEGRKMSKSLGNVVDPVEMCDKYGPDAFRYFLFREVPFGLDGDFSEDALIKRINTELANDLGNLLSRSLTMIEKYRGGVVPEQTGRDDFTVKVEEWIFENTFKKITEKHFDRLEFHNELLHIWLLISEANKYIEDSAPWKVKDEERLSVILYNLVEALRISAVYLSPFMPSKANEIWRQIGLKQEIEDIKRFDEAVKWGAYFKGGEKTQKGNPLFPRIETAKAEAKMEEAVQTENLISIEDFRKVEIKVGKVVHAEFLKGSNKLVRLEVDAGEGSPRQVVAGIGKQYKAEELMGKNIAVVTNLKPAKLMGVESKGMLLAATDSDGNLSILTPERDVKPGARVS